MSTTSRSGGTSRAYTDSADLEDLLGMVYSRFDRSGRQTGPVRQNSVSGSSSPSGPRIANGYSFGDTAWLESEFAASGLPDSYRDVFMSNPYITEYNSLRSVDQSGFVPGLTHFFGMQTGVDKDLITAKMNAIKYINDLQESYRKDQYNSPSMAAARENAAGINSSLVGVGDVAPASNNPEPAFDSPLEGNTVSSSLGVLGDVINPFVNIAKNFLSLSSQFQSLKSLKLDNNIKNVSAITSIDDLARTLAFDSVTPNDFADGVDPSSETYINASLAQAESLANNYFPGSSPRDIHNRKVFNNAFNQHRSSIRNNARTYEEFLKIRKAQLSPEIRDTQKSGQLTDLALAHDVYAAQVSSLYAQWELEFTKDPDFKKIWKEERYADLREKIASSNLSIQQDEFEEEVWRNLNADDDAKLSAWNSVKEEFIAREKEFAAQAARADLQAYDYSLLSYYAHLMRGDYEDYTFDDFLNEKNYDNKFSSKRKAFDDAMKRAGSYSLDSSPAYTVSKLGEVIFKGSKSGKN